jgi:hypothetical protein
MGCGTYGALGGVNLGRRLGVKSHADPQPREVGGRQDTEGDVRRPHHQENQ